MHIDTDAALVPDDTVPDYCAVFLNTGPAVHATKAFLDVTGAPFVEIRIRNDGGVVWVHTGKGNLRICGIRGDVVVQDDRVTLPLDALEARQP